MAKRNYLVVGTVPEISTFYQKLSQLSIKIASFKLKINFRRIFYSNFSPIYLLGRFYNNNFFYK